LNFTLMTPVATPIAARMPSTTTTLSRDLIMGHEISPTGSGQRGQRR
jgi:hypothetical protein